MESSAVKLSTQHNVGMEVIQLLRLSICIQIIVIMWIFSHLYHYQQCHSNIQSLLLWKIHDRPRWIWKHRDSHGTVMVPRPLVEYNTVSEILGYDTREDPVDSNFFKCVGESIRSPCNIFRELAPFRVINYEGAEIKFTDFIPGLRSLTYKADLVSLGGKYIPKGFHIPKQSKEFLQYAYSLEQKTKWMQKHHENRGVQWKEFDELDLSQNSLIQEFISNPFLIDGRKFSIGVYVAFPSGNPLRAYVLDSSYSLRFCSKPYDHQDLSDNTTYITDGVGFGILKIRQIKSLRHYNLDLQYSSIHSLRAYFNSFGGNWSSVTFQIMDAVRDVLSRRKDRIIQTINSSITSRFFQWTRWDFILDSDFKIHLIEANIIPGLQCETYTVDQVDKHVCNNVVYNLFRVMGIASFYDFRRTSIHYVIRDSDINIEPDICYTPTCNQCNIKECQLCTKCLSANQRYILKSVLWEHLRRGNMKSAYPFNSNEPNGTGSTSSKSLDDDTLTTEWLRLKCLRDIQWCDGG